MIGDCLRNRITNYINLVKNNLDSTRILLLATIFTCDLSAKVVVEVADIKYGNLNRVESFIGSVYFKETSSIASPAQGIVQSVFFDVGQRVKKGQRLLKLESDVLLQDITIKESKIAEAKYALERQKGELNRYKRLLDSKSISLQQYENLEYESKSQEARITALKAELEISKSQLAQKIVYAPFDGIIVEKKIHIGEWVQVGQAICQILNSKDTEVIIDVPSSVARNIKLNQQATLVIGSKKHSGIITAIIPKADMLSRTFPVHISVNNDGSFLDGLAAEVLLDISGSQEGFIVPRDSVVYKHNKAYVFIINNNKAKRVDVNVLTIQGANSLVLGAGLRQGSKIVHRGQDILRDGMEVEIKNRK